MTLNHEDFQFSLRFQDDRLGDIQKVSSKYQSIQIVANVARYLDFEGAEYSFYSSQISNLN
jgi:hypothetical protein